MDDATEEAPGATKPKLLQPPPTNRGRPFVSSKLAGVVKREALEVTYGFHEPPKHFRTCYKLLGCDAAGPFSLHAPVRYELKRAIMQSGKSEAEGGLLVYRSVQDAALREDAAFCTRRRADGVSLVVAKVLAWNTSISQLPIKHGSKLAYSFAYIVELLPLPSVYDAPPSSEPVVDIKAACLTTNEPPPAPPQGVPRPGVPDAPTPSYRKQHSKAEALEAQVDELQQRYLDAMSQWNAGPSAVTSSAAAAGSKEAAAATKAAKRPAGSNR